MSQSSKSGWDFGELFPVEPVRKVLSVSELTTQVKRVLEKSVGQVWVCGEVTNLRVQASGHRYFSLKDAGAQLSCVLFRGVVAGQRDLLCDGQKVLLQGEVTVYEARGQYQLIVRAVELQGIGALQIKFEQLKQKLSAQGWFAAERKRALPRYPQRLGLVTSPSGAAIRDVLHVIERRDPSLEIILVPCRVQGDGAAAEIARAVRLLNDYHRALGPAPRSGGGAARPLDLILITRGGGSLEDLWAFNEEIVARAIFESEVPVMSAVGHEIDFTISDFVADVRAATPSAAAELITEGVFASREFVAAAADRILELLTRQFAGKAEELIQLQERFLRAHPRRRLQQGMQRWDDLHASLRRCLRQGLRERRLAWRNLAERLRRVRPAHLLEQRRERWRLQTRRLAELASARLRRARSDQQALEGRLRLLGPEQVLARGYSITMEAKSGRVLREAAGLKAGYLIKTRLHSGDLVSRVEA